MQKPFSAITSVLYFQPVMMTGCKYSQDIRLFNTRLQDILHSCIMLMKNYDSTVNLKFRSRRFFEVLQLRACFYDSCFSLGPTQRKHAAELINKPTFSQDSLLPRLFPSFLMSLMRQQSLSHMVAIQLLFAIKARTWLQLIYVWLSCVINNNSWRLEMLRFAWNLRIPKMSHFCGQTIIFTFPQATWLWQCKMQYNVSLYPESCTYSWNIITRYYTRTCNWCGCVFKSLPNILSNWKQPSCA